MPEWDSNSKLNKQLHTLTGRKTTGAPDLTELKVGIANAIQQGNEEVAQQLMDYGVEAMPGKLVSNTDSMIQPKKLEMYNKVKIKALERFQSAGQKVIDQNKAGLATAKVFNTMAGGGGWGLPKSVVALPYSDAVDTAQDMIPQDHSIGGANQYLNVTGPGFMGGTYTDFSYNPAAQIGMGGPVPTMDFQAKMPAMPMMEDVLLAITVAKMGYEALKLGAKGAHGTYKYFNPDPKKLSKKEKAALEVAKKERKEWFDIVGGGKEINPKMKEFLEEHPNFDVNTPNDAGQSVVHLLADQFKPATMKLLMDHGARINALDMDGNTALHHAVMSDNRRAVEDLVKKGANINVPNPKTGKTPMDVSHDVSDVSVSPFTPDFVSEKSEVTKVLENTEIAGKALIAAAKTGDEKKLTALLEASPHLINYQNEKGETPIFVATQSNKMGAVKALSDRGGNFAIENEDGIHAGNLAAQRVEDIVLNVRDGEDLLGNETVQTKVLNRALKAMPETMRAFSLGAKLDDKDNQIIHIAAANSNDEVLKVLVDHGASLTSENKRGDRALDVATDRHNNSWSQSLNTYGWDTSSPEMEYLQEATVKEETKGIKYNRHLAQFNKIPKQEEKQKETKAKKGNRVERDTADTTALDKEYKLQREVAVKDGLTTPLHVAAKYGQGNVVKKLLAANTNIDAQDKNGHTPFHYASSSEQKGIAHALVAAGANINARDKQGKTMLHHAVMNDNPGLIKDLLEQGANVHIVNNNNMTPEDLAISTNGVYEGEKAHLVSALKDYREAGDALVAAATKGDEGVVKRMLKETPYLVNYKNAVDDTPLHGAAKKGHKEIAELLVTKGANLAIANDDGKTAADLAYDKSNGWLADKLGYKDTAEVGAVLSDMSPHKLEQIQGKVAQRQEAVNRLERFAVRVGAKRATSQAARALMNAAASGEIDTVNAILKKRPGLIFYQDTNTNTPLHMAAEQGQEKMLKLLVEKGAKVYAQNAKGETALQLAEAQQLTWKGALANAMSPQGLYEDPTKAIEFLEGEQQKLDALVEGLTPRKGMPLAIMDATPEYKQQMEREKEERDNKFVANERKDPFAHKNRAMQELKNKKEAISIIEKLAKEHKDRKVGKVLLEDLKDGDKKTREDLVRFASAGSIEDVAKVLKKYPKLLNAPMNEYGNTVLHIAAENSHPELSQALVTMGADVLKTNNYNQDAYDLAQETAGKTWITTDKKAEAVMDFLGPEMAKEKRKLAREANLASSPKKTRQREIANAVIKGAKRKIAEEAEVKRVNNAQTKIAKGVRGLLAKNKVGKLKKEFERETADFTLVLSKKDKKTAKQKQKVAQEKEAAVLKAAKEKEAAVLKAAKEKEDKLQQAAKEELKRVNNAQTKIAKGVRGLLAKNKVAQEKEAAVLKAAKEKGGGAVVHPGGEASLNTAYKQVDKLVAPIISKSNISPAEVANFAKTKEQEKSSSAKAKESIEQEVKDFVVAAKAYAKKEGRSNLEDMLEFYQRTVVENSGNNIEKITNQMIQDDFIKGKDRIKSDPIAMLRRAMTTKATDRDVFLKMVEEFSKNPSKGFQDPGKVAVTRTGGYKTTSRQ